MPEGDTVWRLAQRLHDALTGGPLTRCELRVPRLATVDLTGRGVLGVIPRGKHLLTRFEGGLTLHSHLRMDGAWQIYAPAERWRGGPAHQIRAILGTAAHTAVGYRLPVLDLLRTADESRVVGHLGPDLLGPDWDPEEALRRLLATPGRPLGEALLDQRNLAGIGNVYKAELCFLLHASPWLPLGALPRPDRVPTLAKKLLEANKRRPARVTTPSARPDRRLWVYGRAGRPCLRCGTEIRSADQDPATDERVTYWCPTCQPDPPAARPTGPKDLPHPN
ncbi:Fpg/Nei family DNA glycosylase [Streptomyces tubercidicus]|uniref:DNA-(apurinic or apyrimidinic site) lyase n=1 Tax=Streptomyces tubercidicus TaxID=47759 RepID=A0A640UQ89_9ACTN|nr:DNA-formamidopyrimidine glycosylase family protein [Streptomyces tubercidicus]WAU11570.1 Fpg/Nei family DNA glycosylase [Streptomyces tubercidicus]GFE36871.1 putative endonuclease 8 2 [Streptomyces tubercidicus]